MGMRYSPGLYSPIREARALGQDARMAGCNLSLLLLILYPLTCSAETTDTGGNIRAYAAEISRLNRTGSPKVISGVCASACTMYLGVRKVCVHPDSYHPSDFQVVQSG